MPDRLEKSPCDERARTAFHEAGHAVAAIVLDRPFTDVTVGLTGHDLGGVTQLGASEWDDTQEPTFLARVAAQVVMAYAGPTAEERHTGADPGVGALSDYATAEWFAEYAGETDAVPDYLQRRRADAQALIEANWGKVELLAAALLNRPRLTSVEAKAITEQTDGE